MIVQARTGVLTAGDAVVELSTREGWHIGAVQVGPHGLRVLVAETRGGTIPTPVVGELR